MYEMKIETNLLHDNPLNAAIYGDDFPVQLEQLVEKIKSGRLQYTSP